MIWSVYDNKLGILCTFFEGQIKGSDILEYFQDIASHREYPRVLKVLLDANKAKVSFQLEELESIAKINWQLLKLYDSIFTACIVNTPDETAFSFLYKQFSEIDDYRFTSFSTKEAGIDWLCKVF